MRKILSLFVVCCMAIAMQAKVAYLIPKVEKSESVRNDLPYEAVDEKEQSPERRAYDWIHATFTDCVDLYLSDLTNIPTDVSAIWIYVDRVDFSKESFDALFGSYILALQTYVNNGGNIFLAKQATRLEKDLVSAKKSGGEVIEPDYACGGYREAATWFVDFKFYDKEEATGRWGTYAGHAMYKDLPYKDDNVAELIWSNGQRITDNNCGISIDAMEMGDIWDGNQLWNFEQRNNCKVLGGWANGDGCHYGGMIEFYPSNNRKGTVIMMGLAAYSFIYNNEESGNGWKNTIKLTESILKYLSKPVLTWNNEPVGGAIFTQQDNATVGSETQGLTITYASSNGDVAYIFDGHKIQHQGIGECDINVTYVGDGFANSSKTAYTMTKHIAVEPFLNENAQIAYVLTANSLNALDSQDAKDAENQDPMYQSALWFYNTYCTNPEYMIGSIITANQIATTPAQVIWLDIDRNFADEAALKAYLAPFKEPIANAVKEGKNVYLSKFAVALVSEMGRYATLPQTIGYNKSYEVNDVWSMGRHSDYKFKHAIFREFSTKSHPITLMSGTNCTDRNCVWNDHEFDAVADAVDLGGWYNGDDQGSCAGLVEFYPTGDWKGTIIANGVAAYQWGRCNQTSLDGEPWATFNTRRLTDNIFLYLKQYEADGFVWDIAPENGPLGSTQKVTIEHKDYGDCAAIQWTASNSNANIVASDENCEQAILTLAALGDVTIKATRVGDGIFKPLNVTPSSVEKTITISNTYTRDVISNTYGTICLPFAATAFAGAEMYSVVGKMEDGQGIYMDQVAIMEAGVPYIYLATNNQLSVTYATGEAQEAQTKNGLVGYINVNDEVIPAGEDNYIIYNDLLYLVDSEVKIATNHAYIHWGDVPAKPAAAPAIKRVAMPMHNTPTTIMNTKSNVRITKAIKDGQIVIVRDNKMYNVLGQDY